MSLPPKLHEKYLNRFDDLITERGKILESMLNHMFNVFDIGLRESFVIIGGAGEGIVEQIDGVIEIDGHIYFVEMKWWDKPLGVSEISQHLVRIYHRAESRAIIISASDFTAPAITEDGLANILSKCKATIKNAVLRKELPRPVRFMGKNTWTVDFILRFFEKKLLEENKRFSKLSPYE